MTADGHFCTGFGCVACVLKSFPKPAVETVAQDERGWYPLNAPMGRWDMPSEESASELLPEPKQSGWLSMRRMSDEEAIRWRVRQWREEGLGDDS